MSRNNTSGAVRLERVNRLDAVLGLGADDELGPQSAEHFQELVAQDRLVLGDHCRDGAHREPRDGEPPDRRERGEDVNGRSVPVAGHPGQADADARTAMPTFTVASQRVGRFDAPSGLLPALWRGQDYRRRAALGKSGAINVGSRPGGENATVPANLGVNPVAAGVKPVANATNEPPSRVGRRRGRRVAPVERRRSGPVEWTFFDRGNRMSYAQHRRRDPRSRRSHPLEPPAADECAERCAGCRAVSGARCVRCAMPASAPSSSPATTRRSPPAPTSARWPNGTTRRSTRTTTSPATGRTCARSASR